MKTDYLILAIDTSCDETSAAVTKNDLVLSNTISSQIKIHKKHGGVVPNLAKRAHQQRLNPVIKTALKTGGVKQNELQAIAVTQGPGLAPALETGIAKAKQLVKKLNKPLIAVNHMEGHLLSAMAKNPQGQGPFAKTKPKPPILGLLVSGGHTQLVLIKAFGQYQLLGQTLDDAAGEAFDKVAKMLGLDYPGGPAISKLARKGKPKYSLPIPMKRSNDLNFSFSGLKTACLYKLRQLKADQVRFDQQSISDFAASFEQAAVRSLILKLEKAIKKHRPNQLVMGGGVVNNPHLQTQAKQTAKKFNLDLFIPYSKRLLTDNAAMIGITAWHKAQRKEFVNQPQTLDRKPNLSF